MTNYLELIDPDCQTGSHRACPGWTFDIDTDDVGACECPCHLED